MEKREYQRDMIRMEEGKEITLDRLRQINIKAKNFPS